MLDAYLSGPGNYLVNVGTWFVYDPVSGSTGNGAIGMNRRTRFSDLRDGSSSTLGMSEGKTFTPILRDGGNPATLGIVVPTLPAEVTAYGGAFKLDSGHVEWIDARSIQSGFTVTFPPNTQVPFTSSGVTYDVDFTSRREGKSATVPTYSTVTVRSYHPGGVNALLMDGSVRFVGETISQRVWRALGTRSGGEFVADF